MSIFGKIISIVLNIICAFGATLVLVGLILSCWFFFASEQENKLYWGAVSCCCMRWIYNLSIYIPKNS